MQISNLYFMNVYENPRIMRKIREKFRGCTYKSTPISAVSYHRVPNMVVYDDVSI